MARYGMVIDLTRCSGCQTCVVACQMQHNTRPGVRWGSVDFVERGTWPGGHRFALPHACMHCENAPCVGACPTGASAQREDGIVTVDYDACIACGACVGACPFGARRMSADDVRFFGADEPAPYEAYGTQRINVAEKCSFCVERVDAGEQPWCASVCPNAARIFGDLDDPESDAAKAVAAGAEQVPGTSVYYVQGANRLDVMQALADLAAAQADEKDGE